MHLSWKLTKCSREGTGLQYLRVSWVTGLRKEGQLDMVLPKPLWWKQSRAGTRCVVPRTPWKHSLWATPPCSPRSHCLLKCPGSGAGSGELCGNAWRRLCSGRISAPGAAGGETDTQSWSKLNKLLITRVSPLLWAWARCPPRWASCSEAFSSAACRSS